MMKRSIAFALICSFTISLWAQTFKGRVVDLAGNPIPYAALYLKELKTGFTTDDNGCFQTSLPAGQYTCEVSSLGFAGQTFSFSISAGERLTVRQNAPRQSSGKNAASQMFS